MAVKDMDDGRGKKKREPRLQSKELPVVQAGRRTGKIEDFFGILADKTKKVATIEEMNEAAARGWAGIK
jgi:hypothetical protein